MTKTMKRVTWIWKYNWGRVLEADRC